MCFIQRPEELDRIELGLSAPSPQTLKAWEGIPGVDNVMAEDGTATILAQDSNTILPRLFEAANKFDARVTSVEIFEPNLETVFLHLTGRALRD